MCGIANFINKSRQTLPGIDDGIKVLGAARFRLIKFLETPQGQKAVRIFSGADCAQGLYNWKNDGYGGHFFTLVGCGIFLTSK